MRLPATFFEFRCQFLFPSSPKRYLNHVIEQNCYFHYLERRNFESSYDIMLCNFYHMATRYASVFIYDNRVFVGKNMKFYINK